MVNWRRKCKTEGNVEYFKRVKFRNDVEIMHWTVLAKLHCVTVCVCIVCVNMALDVCALEILNPIGGNLHQQHNNTHLAPQILRMDNPNKSEIESVAVAAVVAASVNASRRLQPAQNQLIYN